MSTSRPPAEPATTTTHLLGPTGVVCGFPAHAHFNHGWSKNLKSVTCGDCLRVAAAASSEGYPCPSCGQPTQYASFSGGKEYECLHCGDQGTYPDDAPGLPRATLLRTDEGREQLRHDMRAEVARRVAERGNPAPEAPGDMERG